MNFFNFLIKNFNLKIIYDRLFLEKWKGVSHEVERLLNTDKKKKLNKINSNFKFRINRIPFIFETIYSTPKILKKFQ